jgi:hypothetical protein
MHHTCRPQPASGLESTISTSLPATHARQRHLKPSVYLGPFKVLSDYANNNNNPQIYSRPFKM